MLTAQKTLPPRRPPAIAFGGPSAEVSAAGGALLAPSTSQVSARNQASHDACLSTLWGRRATCGVTESLNSSAAASPLQGITGASAIGAGGGLHLQREAAESALGGKPPWVHWARPGPPSAKAGDAAWAAHPRSACCRCPPAGWTGDPGIHHQHTAGRGLDRTAPQAAAARRSSQDARGGLGRNSAGFRCTALRRQTHRHAQASNRLGGRRTGGHAQPTKFSQVTPRKLEYPHDFGALPELTHVRRRDCRMMAAGAHGWLTAAEVGTTAASYGDRDLPG